MKKLVSLILALAMVFAMTICVSAQADYTHAELEALEAKATKKTGTLTINGATAGTTYTLYRILNIEKAVSDKENVYLLNEKWGNFMSRYPGITVSNGYVKGLTELSTINVQELAKAVVEHAREHNVENDGQAMMTMSGNYASSTPRQYGYYVLASDRSGAGVKYTVFELNRATESIFEKNEGTVKFEKYVQEDSAVTSTDSGWYTNNSAEIAQDVHFKIILTMAAGTDTYKIVDTMPNFRAIDKNTFHVEYSGGVMERGDHYTLTFTDSDDSTEGNSVVTGFEFTVMPTFRQQVIDNQTLTITYTAKLRYDANVGGDKFNENTATLSYKKEGEPATLKAVTKTITHEINVLKVNEADKPLAKAEFELRHGERTLTFFQNGTIYTVADPNHEINGKKPSATIITDETGAFIIRGLDTTSGGADVYTLVETKAPGGYIEMEPEIIDITTNDAHVHSVKVVNLPGVEMPETGGMGTTLFYVLGAVLACGAAVLLVTKKRMSAN